MFQLSSERKLHLARVHWSSGRKTTAKRSCTDCGVIHGIKYNINVYVWIIFSSFLLLKDAAYVVASVQNDIPILS